MGWISKRHMQRGGSIGTGPAGGKHKGPLRRITRVLKESESMFDPSFVEMECGHQGISYGGVRARCAACGRGEGAR